MNEKIINKYETREVEANIFEYSNRLFDLLKSRDEAKLGNDNYFPANRSLKDDGIFRYEIEELLKSFVNESVSIVIDEEMLDEKYTNIIDGALELVYDLEMRLHRCNNEIEMNLEDIKIKLEG